MTFLRPWIFWLLPFYLAIEAFLYYKIRSNSMNLPTAGFVGARETWRTQILRRMRLLPILASVFILVALSGPQQVDTSRETLPSGIDILVALDVSGSMAAEDFQPLNRLEVAKDLLRDFIRGRPSDRIGLTVFAGKSITRCPLTLEHEPLIRTVETLRMGDLPEGTAIGSAIMSGINRLTQQSSSKGDRILLLITDGRSNAGEIHPRDALSLAVSQKIKIYSIGVGSNGKVPFPVAMPNGKKSYRYETVDIDEDLLREIAGRSGGKYFRATDPKSLQLLFEQINTLEASEPRVVEARTIQDRATRFAVPALLLALCYTLLTTYIVRLP